MLEARHPPPPHRLLLPSPTLSPLSASTLPLLSHACCSLSGDSSSVMTVNSSVLPFSWIFSLFMRVTISCSLSWAWELDADAAAPFPSPPSLGVIIRVCFLPHQLQEHSQTYLFAIDFFCFFSTRKICENWIRLLIAVHARNGGGDVVPNMLRDISVSVWKKKSKSYLCLFATTAHTTRITAMATITKMITSQSGRRGK